MRSWKGNLLLLLFGILLGFLLLEVGLATVSGVRKGFRPQKTILFVHEGGGVCYAPGGTGTLPLDARKEEDRLRIVQTASRWYAFGVTRSLPELLEETPHCVLYDVPRRQQGSQAHRKVEVPLFGDSFAFGDGLPFEETLGGLLAERDKTANYRSFAECGAGVENVLAQVRRYLAERPAEAAEVREALYFLHLNDGMVPLAGSESEELRQLEDVRWQNQHFGPHSWWEKVASRTYTWWAIRALQLREFVSEKMTRAYRDWYFDDGHEEARQQFRATMRTLDGLLAEQGIALHVVIYPLLVADSDGNYPFQELHDALMAWCAEDGLTCHDPASAVLAAGEVGELVVHPRDTHPNGRANRAVVDYVLARVLPR